LYLKSLTLRGFKSFASSTTLEFEPGITCVVGPNGSGKSNVVDALAWVMGEQGAKTLRGGQMQDVIFAGTSGRAPLGRAEVVLTIDNADGALPVEYAEVTVSRTMFRAGGSEYAINGQPCRLLDVQDLLSDSGIGREMHVVVGQGQLDSILQATPEDRRGFIEEAAGVLKHRKRKEKALRRLDATEANLTRVQDLLGEIRRQLKPLGKQADVARRAATVQADLRDARARLLADDLVGARTAFERELADESARRARRADVEAAVLAAREDESRLARELAEDAAASARAQETWYRLAGMRDRIAGTAELAGERLRRATEDTERTAESVRADQEPDALAAEAARVRDQEAAIAAEVAQLRRALAGAVESRQAAELAHAEEDHRVTSLVREAADRREGRARMHGRQHALRSRAAAADDEIARLATARRSADERAERAQTDFTVLENQVAGLDAGESGLDSAYDAATAHLVDVESRLGKAREEAQLAERERAALAARQEALELGLTQRDGAGALLSDADDESGVLGSVAALLMVRPGYESAVATALGSVADAVAVADLGAAVGALRRLRDHDLGRSGLIVGAAGSSNESPLPAAPAGTIAVLDVLEAPEALRPALAACLAGTVVVDDLDAARNVVSARPDLTAVTRVGDLLGRHTAVGGPPGGQSRLEVQAALDDATGRLVDATQDSERLRFAQAGLDEELADARLRADAALAALHESDATMAALAEQLAQLSATAQSARAESDRLATAIEEAEQARDQHLAGVFELEQGSADEEEVADDDGAELARRADAARARRAAETEARLVLRTAEERARAITGRADSLDRAARAERKARAQVLARRAQRLREAAVADAVGHAATRTLARLGRSLDSAAAQRAEIDQARAGRDERLRAVQSQARDLDAELARLTDSVHRDEVSRAEQRLRLEALEQRALEEVGLDVDALVAGYGPDVPVPAADDGDEPRPYDRDVELRRFRAAERALALLGRVNPLALEEFGALEERHRFLAEQLEDVRRTRKDLLGLISEVEDHVQRVFAEAYADVEVQFEAVFSRLFPGGTGRLVLTDPSDLLVSGVDVEARPPGKKVKRLSLLSGGERALVAVTFLVALFKARPSPFYILDEVEAALDDTNLGRLLEIYEELRANSQLIVITHQKRTMEIGDALYGTSMRGDGVTTVISQRLRDPA